MNSSEKWWPFKLQCIMLYGTHSSITYPMPGYVHITSADLCAWLKIPSSRFRQYLLSCQDMDMIEDLKFTKGFAICKVKAGNSHQKESTDVYV